MLTVGELLSLPALKTWSLTPGVGEDRAISWAHVCELAEPWQWLGEGALVMTTGLGIPASTADQCTYFAGMQSAGIAAITISKFMSAPPLAPAALSYATSLGFPVLETAYEVPYISISTAVHDAAQRQRARRLQLTEHMYRSLRQLTPEDDVDQLLSELGELLGGEFSLHPKSEHRAHGSIEEVQPGVYCTSLIAPSEPLLQFRPESGSADYGLLQHSAGIVGTALSISAAARRRDWLYGSMLLNNLLDDAIPAQFADELVREHGLRSPYLVCTWKVANAHTGLDAVQTALMSIDSTALVTVKEQHVIALIGAEDPSTLTKLGEVSGGLGASAPFSDLTAFATAQRQAQIALSRLAAEQRGRGAVARFDEGEPSSMFLPIDTDQLRAITQQVLGPLQAYDRDRGTDLTHTLRVFLEENRSWVRASERLYVHRQTLVSRVARIESVLDRDLGRMEDASECWLAVRAAIRCGELEPSGEPGAEPDPERERSNRTNV